MVWYRLHPSRHLLLLLGRDSGRVTFPLDSPTVICMIMIGAVLINFFLFAENVSCGLR